MTYERIPWADYFSEPSIDQLRNSLVEGSKALFDLTRARIAAVDGVTEKLKWFGDGWHWTLGYFMRQQEDPLAVIIPNPEDLQLAMQIDRKFINGLNPDQIKKPLRDGLELALAPFDTKWAVWSIENENFISDLMDLIELKHRNRSKIAG